MKLITTGFRKQALAFPDRVDALLAEVETVSQAKGYLDQASSMQHYAAKLKAGVEIERPIAIGVLKIKAKLGELLVPENGGRGKKAACQTGDFSKDTRTNYRKIAANQERLEEFLEAVPDEVPSQSDFIRFCGADGSKATKYTGEMDWYTPAEYIEACRGVLGAIDLDPASSEYAQRIVNASEYFTADDDGLSQPWSGRVFMNPPYKMPLIRQFTDKLCDEYEAGNVKAAIVLTNNSTDTLWWHKMANLAAAVCFTKGRIPFYNQAGEFASPTNGQTFCYFGKAVARFERAFDDVGTIFRT